MLGLGTRIDETTGIELVIFSSFTCSLLIMHALIIVSNQVFTSVNDIVTPRAKPLFFQICQENLQALDWIVIFVRWLIFPTIRLGKNVSLAML